MSKPSKADMLEMVERRARTVAVVEQVGQTIRTLFLVLGGCFFAWCLRMIAEDLAGKVTDANIALKVLGNLSFSISTAWIFGGGGVAYGYAQNRLKRQAIEKMHKRVLELETIIDSDRTSSRLAPTGETNPKDK